MLDRRVADRWAGRERAAINGVDGLLKHAGDQEAIEAQTLALKLDNKEARQRASADGSLSRAGQPRWIGAQIISVAESPEPFAERIETKEHHRRGIQRQDLTDDQAAYYGDPQRMTQFGTFAFAESERQRAE